MTKRNPMPPGRWSEIVERDFCCQAYAYQFPTDSTCSGGFVVHHRRTRGMGGGSDPSIHDADKLVCLCDRHHVEVHSRVADAYECGLLLRHTT